MEKGNANQVVLTDKVFLIHDKTTDRFYKPRKFSYGEKIEVHWHNDPKNGKVYHRLSDARAACKNVRDLKRIFDQGTNHRGHYSDMDGITLDLEIMEFDIVHNGVVHPEEKP